MKRSHLLLALIIFFSCSKSNSDSQELENSTQKNIINKSEIAITFDKEPLNSLIETIWIYKPFPDCIDTLRIDSDKGYEYNCELEIKNNLKYTIKDDTLYTELYGYKSEVNADLGKEIKTKCKYIKSGGKLIAVYRALRYNNRIQPVEKKYLYQKYSQLK